MNRHERRAREAQTPIFFSMDQEGIVAGLAPREREECDLALRLVYDEQLRFLAATCRADLEGLAMGWAARNNELPPEAVDEQAYTVLVGFLKHEGYIGEAIVEEVVLAMAWIGWQLPASDKPELEIKITPKGTLQ